MVGELSDGVAREWWQQDQQVNFVVLYVFNATTRVSVCCAVWCGVVWCMRVRESVMLNENHNNNHHHHEHQHHERHENNYNYRCCAWRFKWRDRCKDTLHTLIIIDGRKYVNVQERRKKK